MDIITKSLLDGLKAIVIVLLTILMAVCAAWVAVGWLAIIITCGTNALTMFIWLAIWLFTSAFLIGIAGRLE